MTMNLPKRVKLVDVGPRDGLQNEPGVVPTEVKIQLIDLLSDAGLPVVEATSFVSPRWVPQMADNAQVMAGIKRKPGVSYPVLVPNLKGLEAAMTADVEEVAVFAAATEAFSHRNTNCSIVESFERFIPVCRTALDNGLKVRGYVSVAFECPFEGAVDPAATAEVSARLYDMGCYEISLGDTIGAATPAKVKSIIDATAQRVPVDKLAGHYHDTYGQALVNILASLELGIAAFDASIAGLGGCPYAPGATGNVATEDVLYMLDGMGIETGVDMTRLLVAAQFISGALGRPTASRAGRALAAKAAREAKKQDRAA
jgi:hydroxymethylglutaryl-CoA lyase